MELETDVCAYCGASELPDAPAPAMDDDAAWARLAREHLDRCEWVETRAHRMEE